MPKSPLWDNSGELMRWGLDGFQIDLREAVVLTETEAG